jgi:hypothetical protein
MTYDEKLTVVTATGRVIQEGGEGLLIVAEDERCEVMQLDEVSDEKVVNIFLKCLHPIDKCLQMGWNRLEFPNPMTHEILISRSPHPPSLSRLS